MNFRSHESRIGDTAGLGASIEGFNETSAKPFRRTYTGKPLMV